MTYTTFFFSVHSDILLNLSLTPFLAERQYHMSFVLKHFKEINLKNKYVYIYNCLTDCGAYRIIPMGGRLTKI